MSRPRHTRDGTRRRDFYSLIDPRPRFRPHAPKSDDDPATQETAASDAATAAAAAAALGDTTTARTEAKAAAEAYAIAAFDSVLASLSTYTTNAPECRTRGGTATLIGHEEFTSPSSPPKKYRTKTLSGEYQKCGYGNFSSCPSTLGPFAGTNGLKYSGSISYHPLTGAVTDTTLKQHGTGGGGGTCAAVGSWTDWVPPNVSSAVETLTSGSYLARVTTQIADYNTTDGSCSTTYGTYPERIDVMTLRNDLSDEDTEADAITRLQASASWGSWSAATSTSCKASYEQRTSGFSFAYTEAGFRDTISIPSGQTGILKVGLYRRARGSSDPWVLYATEVFFLTGDGSNQDTIEFTYAADPGYEAYAAGLPVGS